MKIPKCPKTITGQHRFDNFMDGYEQYLRDKEGEVMAGIPKNIIKCSFCGLVDDRKIKK